MKMGSLFDGIGGFPLAASRYGIESVWASEIEPFPIRVTKHHFPDMEHLGDICQINGAEIEPVDVITFGSPCQDLSIAGKREGLQGDRSGLFSHATRIIREMRGSTGGQFPRFAIWENVPGAFSSNKGQDFRAVLEEITETEIPMPRSGKWAEAGMVRTERVDIAWRCMDAQYWGVPQRRKRIFLVADFRGRCAGEILFVESCLRRDIAESGKAREEVAGNVGDGIAKPIGIDVYNFAESRDIAVTLTANSGSSPTHAGPAVMVSRIDSSPEGISGAVSSKWAKGTGGPAGDECYNLVIEPQLYDMTHADEVIRPVTEGLAPTLNSRMGTGGNQVPIMIKPTACPDPANTLLNKANLSFRDDQDTLVVAIDYRNLCENEKLSGTLQSKTNGGYSLNYQNPVRVGYAVRRLTPLECERLQGIPDHWTNIPGASDTARYRAIGNGIAKPCSDFVLGRIAQVLQGKEAIICVD